MVHLCLSGIICGGVVSLCLDGMGSEGVEFRYG